MKKYTVVDVHKEYWVITAEGFYVNHIGENIPVTTFYIRNGGSVHSEEKVAVFVGQIQL